MNTCISMLFSWFAESESIHLTKYNQRSILYKLHAGIYANMLLALTITLLELSIVNCSLYSMRTPIIILLDRLTYRSAQSNYF